MKEEKWFKSPKIFKRITAVLFALCILMIVLYFIYTGTNVFSDKSGEWANFGQYFGSITGLLAFAGVLYSAALSEERANKADDEVRKREERDQFFKMLELFQKNSQEFIIKNDSNTDTLQSTFAFEYLKDKINGFLFYLLIKNFIENITENNYKHFKNAAINQTSADEIFYGEVFKLTISSHNKSQFSTLDHLSNNEFQFCDFKRVAAKKELYSEIKYYPKKYLYRDKIDMLYTNFDVALDAKTFYNFIINTSSYIFEIKGTRLDVFCNSIKAIISNLKQFKSNTDNYYSLLTSQLSRDQLVLIFIFSFSRFSNNKFVENLLDCKILYELDLADLIIFNSVNYTNKENLWDEIVKLHNYYLEN